MVKALLGAIGDRSAQGVVLHDRVEGVLVRGGGGIGAHVLPAQGCQTQRLRWARLGVQRAPQVQHLSTRQAATTSLATTGPIYFPLASMFLYMRNI